MRPSFHPRPVNGPFEDPVLFIPFFFDKRAILFDLGDLRNLSARELLKIGQVFISHTHMDHFVGFDTLLRIFLGREKDLHLFGPPPLLHNVEGKLAGYTWNLVHTYQNRFSIRVTEVHPDRSLTKEYRCSEAFSPDHKAKPHSFDGTLIEEDSFSVKAVHLDHKIPCLAFKLEERFHVNIMKDRLFTLGIPVGPWLKSFKEALYRGDNAESDFLVVWNENRKEMRRTFRLGDLGKKIARISPGQKIVYVVDVVYNDENAERIIHFAGDADQLFMEAAFLDEDKDLAAKKYHLTARQAGMLARRANVKALTICHFSPKYKQAPHRLTTEALAAFLGTDAHL
jgi:ribonuclease Z